MPKLNERHEGTVCGGKKDVWRQGTCALRIQYVLGRRDHMESQPLEMNHLNNLCVMLSSNTAITMVESN